MTITVVANHPHYTLGQLLELANEIADRNAPDWDSEFAAALDIARELLAGGTLDSFAHAWDTWASWGQPLPFSVEADGRCTGCSAHCEPCAAVGAD